MLPDVYIRRMISGFSVRSVSGMTKLVGKWSASGFDLKWPLDRRK